MWTALVVFLVTSAGWMYYGLKREGAIEEKYRGQIVQMRNQHREDLEAISALSSSLDVMRQGYEYLDKERGRVDRELQKAKRDAAVVRYLAQPVPSGMQSVYKDRHCLQLPGSCKPDETVASGVPGDSNQ